jgi:hypothetical protein
MRSTFILTLAAFAAAQLAAAPAARAQQAWVQLGCRDVNWAVDRDIIRPARRDGRFSAVRLRVIGNDVRMLDLKVVYGGGAPDDLPVRAVIRAGGQSGALDLRGRDRAIDRVEMIYEARRGFRGRAVVCVDGLQVVAPAPKWVVLGCRDVNWAVDRDVLRVGRDDGRFTAIRLRVAGNDVHMLDLKVVYGNGTSDDIPVRAVIRAGKQSGALDLQGHERVIDRIAMIYEARRGFRGRAQVCVDGRSG